MNKKQIKPKYFLNCNVELKFIETKGGDGAIRFSGMANTIDKDRTDEIVLPKAFTKSLPEYMENPVLLYQHDWDKLVGRIDVAKIIDNGLYVEGTISGAKDADDVRIKVKEKMLRTLSIGFNEVDADMDEKTNIKTIKELDLLEINKMKNLIEEQSHNVEKKCSYCKNEFDAKDGYYNVPLLIGKELINKLFCRGCGVPHDVYGK